MLHWLRSWLRNLRVPAAGAGTDADDSDDEHSAARSVVKGNHRKALGIGNTFRLRKRVLQSVNMLLDNTHQKTPVRYLVADEVTLHLMDIENWQANFNTLLQYDFPNLTVAVESSPASVSGFIVSITHSEASYLGSVLGPTFSLRSLLLSAAHTFVPLAFYYFLSAQVSRLLNSPAACQALSGLQDTYTGGAAAAGNGNDTFGAYAPTSDLTSTLRSVIAAHQTL